jgi:hypothetical protein
MHPRSLWVSSDICLRCQWRIAYKTQTNARLHTFRNINSAIKLSSTLPRRALHTSSRVGLGTTLRLQSTYGIQRAQLFVESTPIDLAVDPVFVARPPQIPVRNHLGKWQDQYGRPSEETLSAFEKHPLAGEIYNNVSKVSNASAADDETKGDRWFAGEDDDGEDLITIGLFLKPGDVVELS